MWLSLSRIWGFYIKALCGWTMTIYDVKDQCCESFHSNDHTGAELSVDHPVHRCWPQRAGFRTKAVLCQRTGFICKDQLSTAVKCDCFLINSTSVIFTHCVIVNTAMCPIKLIYLSAVIVLKVVQGMLGLHNTVKQRSLQVTRHKLKKFSTAFLKMEQQPGCDKVTSKNQKAC